MSIQATEEYLPQQAGESTLAYRDRIEQHRTEALEVRRRELAEQTSLQNTPAARIRVWERLHQVLLPRSPTHTVLRIVAMATGLTLEEVRAEQQMRSTRDAGGV